ncbi:MAG: YdbL family protein [Desulfobacterales bacterium]|nr:YdbL family protein [Desulfobacterales bacterium]
MLNRNYIRISISLVIALFMLSGTSAYTASIKDRMVARIPAINSLKDKGAIGENNRGFLEYRSSSQPEKSVVQGENKDRQSVYDAIAKKEGVDSKLVGQRRAKQILSMGSPGHWFEKPDGSWFKK